MKTLILIAGKARAGKDTASDYLMSRFGGDLSNNLHLDVTGHLKECYGRVVGRSVKWLDENKDTEMHDGFTYRSGLQVFGNSVMPTVLFKDVWLAERHQRILERNADITILSGIRLLREVEYFQKTFISPQTRVIVLKVCRVQKNGNAFSGVSEADSQHITETDVDRIKADYNVTAKDVEELQDGLKCFMQKYF